MHSFWDIFEIFDFKNAVTLKTGLGVCQGQKKKWQITNSCMHVVIYSQSQRSETGCCMRRDWVIKAAFH